MKTLFQSLALVISITLLFCNTIIAQWTLQGSAPGIGSWPAISVYSSTGLVIAGGYPSTAKVYKSTNSGVNWTDITANLSNTPTIISVCALDENTIFAGDAGAFNAGGGDAKVWKTTNGGLNWNVILSTGGTAGYINGIVFSRSAPSFGIIQSDPPNGAGQPFWIRKTTDGGNTWQSAEAPGIPGSITSDHTINVIDSMFYGFGTYPEPYSYITTNGGLTWSPQPLSIPGSGASGLAFSSDKMYGIGVTGSSLPMVKRTTNGGLNWSNVNSGSSLSGGGRAKWVYGTNMCFVSSNTGSTGSMMMSSDNGASWVPQTTDGVNNINEIDLVYESGTVYAYSVSGSAGNVIRLIINTTGIEPISNIIPEKYSLEQNYPNPFNPVTHLEFGIADLGFVSLKVYDVLGNEVATLINDNLQPGVYEVEWNASGYSSGVYYYRLTSGDFVETKRMLLVK